MATFRVASFCGSDPTEQGRQVENVSMTRAQAAVMESTAARFDRTNEALEQMLRRLMEELSVLHGQWQGAGGRSFEQVKQAWAADQSALHRALAETATAIRTSGRQYHAADAGVAERLGGAARGGMVLPL